MPIRLSKPILAAMGASIGSLGIMNIDRRTQLSNLKDLDESSYKKILKPGDVLVGAETTPDEAIEDYKNDFRKNYIKARKEKGVVSSLKQAITTTYPRSISSKIIHPALSHTELVIDPETAFFIGRGSKNIKDIINAEGAHFVVMRKKGGPKKRDIDKFLLNIGDGGLYNKKETFIAALKDAVSPKLKTFEREKKDVEREIDKEIKSGNCATLPAILDKETIGRKNPKTILPIDYTKSPNWKPVGYFGIAPEDIEMSTGSKIIYGSPKIITQGFVAGAAGGGAYVSSKWIKSLMKTLRRTA